MEEPWFDRVTGPAEDHPNLEASHMVSTKTGAEVVTGLKKNKNLFLFFFTVGHYTLLVIKASFTISCSTAAAAIE